VLRASFELRLIGDRAGSRTKGGLGAVSAAGHCDWSSTQEVRGTMRDARTAARGRKVTVVEVVRLPQREQCGVQLAEERRVLAELVLTAPNHVRHVAFASQP
jgi:hypothetical protein